MKDKFAFDNIVTSMQFGIISDKEAWDLVVALIDGDENTLKKLKEKYGCNSDERIT